MLTVDEQLERRMVSLEQLRLRRDEQVFTAAPSDDALSREGKVFFERGVVMFKRGKYGAAMQAFTAAMRFAPLPEMYYNLGVTAEKLSQRKDAALYFEEYLRLRPRTSDRKMVEARIAKLRTHR